MVIKPLNRNRRRIYSINLVLDKESSNLSVVLNRKKASENSLAALTKPFEGNKSQAISIIGTNSKFKVLHYLFFFSFFLGRVGH